MSERYLLIIPTQHYKALLFLLIWDYDIIPKQFFITLGKYGEIDEVRNKVKYREKER